MDKNITVSVLVFCYNHGEYIGQCIESILEQRTEFEFEVIIHDDCSNDNSLQIIEEYVRKYPDIVKYILEKEPKYLSDPYTVCYTNMLHLASGKYIAWLEGDDYWSDSNKLQRQYEVMERYKECSMCVHKVDLLNCLSNKRMGTVPEYGIVKDKIQKIEGKDVIYRLVKEGTFFAVNSYFVRRKAIEEKDVPEYMLLAKCMDFAKILEAVLFGPIIFLPETMAVKRVYNGGSWSEKDRNRDIERKVNNIRQMNMILESYNEYSKYIYHDELQNGILFNLIKIELFIQGRIDEIERLDIYTGKRRLKNANVYWTIKKRIRSMLLKYKGCYCLILKKDRKSLNNRLEQIVGKRK